MAEEEKKSGAKKQKPKSPLIGAQVQSTTLDNSTKIDIDTKKQFVDDLIAAGLSGNLDTSEIDAFTNISNTRDQVYQLIDTMMNDASVAAIVRTYTEDVCEPADNGHIMWCESDDPKISKFVNYLLDVINVDKNLYGWTHCLIQYGDVYLRLYRESDFEDKLFDHEKIKSADQARTSLTEGVDESIILKTHNINDPYSYYVEMVPDPGTMFELTKYGKTYGYIETPNVKSGSDYLNNYLGMNSNSTQSTGISNFIMKSNDVNVYQADDFVHGFLDDNFSRYPETVNIFLNDDDWKTGTNAQCYSVRRGKSLLYDSYKTWREKSLLESSILLNRITKSSLVRNISVEVGDMPKSQVQNTLRRVKEMFEQKSAINTGSSMAEYTNPGPIENNIYTATHGGQGAITVTAVGGDANVKDLADLDDWTNKFYSSYGIPKQYFGWTDEGGGFNGGTSLSIMSSVYAKGVKRIQNAMIQAVTDIINLILLNKGCKSYLNNFVLKMKAPLTQEEKDYREDLANRVNAISSIQSLFADVEDKARRLEILKTLFATLDYGDNITFQIDEEIKDAEAAKKQAEEEAAAQANAEGGGDLEMPESKPSKPSKSAPSSEPPMDLGGGNGGRGNAPEPAEEPADLDLGLDLGNSSQAPMEGFTKTGGTTLVEGPDFLEESDDLPSPEEADESLDFTQNK